MPISTGKAVLEYRTTPGTGSWVDISDAVSGLSSFSLANGVEPREIPSTANITAMQVIGRVSWSGSIEVDINATTRDEFMRVGSKRTEFRFAPEVANKATGLASGDLRYTFEAITSSAITSDVAGVRTCTVTLNVDGDVTRSTS